MQFDNLPSGFVGLEDLGYHRERERDFLVPADSRPYL
jgi:hypothetical protein